MRSNGSIDHNSSLIIFSLDAYHHRSNIYNLPIIDLLKT